MSDNNTGGDLAKPKVSNSLEASFDREAVETVKDKPRPTDSGGAKYGNPGFRRVHEPFNRLPSGGWGDSD